MPKHDAVRKMTHGQLVDIMQAVMHAIPELTFEQAELLGKNKGELKRAVMEEIFNALTKIEEEDRKTLFNFVDGITEVKSIRSFVAYEDLAVPDKIELSNNFSEELLATEEWDIYSRRLKVAELSRTASNQKILDAFLKSSRDCRINLCHVRGFLEQQDLPGDFVFFIYKHNFYPALWTVRAKFQNNKWLLESAPFDRRCQQAGSRIVFCE